MRIDIREMIKVLCVLMLILNVFQCGYIFAANQMPTDSYSFQITDAPDTAPPYTLGHMPANGAVNISRDSNIVVRIKDDDTGVDIGSIVMRVNGQAVVPVITGTPSEYTLTYDPAQDFMYGQEVFVTIDANDLAP